MAQVHGGRLVAQGLRRHGVQQVFTLCGGHVQAIYDGCLDEGIRVVDTRVGATAVHAAEGVARLTQKTGVAVVGAGPGVSEVITPLASASRANMPVLCLAGGVPLSLADCGALLDVDALAMVKPVTKWAARVGSTERLLEYVDTALNRALCGVPGPVFLEIPLDILMNFAEDIPPMTAPLVAPIPSPSPQDIHQFVQLLRAAGRPVFVVGSDIYRSPSRDVLDSFARAVSAPYYLNGMARGGIGDSCPGLLSRSRREALAEADLVVVMGTPLDFRLDYGRPPAWASDAKVIQVALQADHLAQNRRVDLAMLADIGLTLDAVLQELGQKQCPQWLSRLQALEAERLPSTPETVPAALPSPAEVYGTVAQSLGPDDILIADGGDFAAGATGRIPLRWPQVLLDPGPLGALGVAPGFAMAAKLARPKGRVVGLLGDGAIGLRLAEFESLARNKIPFVAVVGNDGGWGQVRRGQRQLYGPDRQVATRLSQTRYDQVAETLGARGWNVEQANQLRPALEEALASDEPCCINVMLAPRF